MELNNDRDNGSHSVEVSQRLLPYDPFKTVSNKEKMIGHTVIEDSLTRRTEELICCLDQPLREVCASVVHGLKM